MALNVLSLREKTRRKTDTLRQTKINRGEAETLKIAREILGHSLRKPIIASRGMKVSLLSSAAC